MCVTAYLWFHAKSPPDMQTNSMYIENILCQPKDCYKCVSLLKSKEPSLIAARFIQYRTSLVVQMVKNLPTMQETWVRCLSREDLLEKVSATHSSILAWRIPWAEESGRLQFMWLQKVRHD